jgi:hypothetical protein
MEPKEHFATFQLNFNWSMSERNIVEELYVTRRRPKFSVEFNLKNSKEI